MNLQTAKGVKDFNPEVMLARQHVINTLKSVFESYGFVPLQTPTIERLDILSAKYAGGDEILKETFRLTDQGGRDLGLRYDLTVPLARFVGMNPILKMPFKRYQIGQVFRDGPVKAGRLREFTQVDVDIIGGKNILADAECIKIALDGFSKLKIKVMVEVSNRKVLDGIMDYCGVKEKNRIPVILIIDKLKKVEKSETEKELKCKGITRTVVQRLLETFQISGNNRDKIKKLRKIIKSESGNQGLDELEELFSYVSSKNVNFNISLARGLAYYTGTVFEVFSTGDFAGSIAGGGRYDSLIQEYLGSKREFPAVGISFGMEPISVVMKNKSMPSIVDVYVSPIKSTKDGLRISESLRRAGLKVEMDISERGISKNLDYASSKKIPYVLIFGKKELGEGKVKLKNMVSGEEQNLTVDKVISKIQSL